MNASVAARLIEVSSSLVRVCSMQSTWAFMGWFVISQMTLFLLGPTFVSTNCISNFEGNCSYRHSSFRLAMSWFVLLVVMFLNTRLCLSNTATTLQICNKYRNWITVKLGILLSVYVLTPDTAVELYGSFISPLLACGWIFYQGYVVIHCAHLLQSWIASILLKSVREMSFRTHLFNNAGGNGAPSSLVYIARMLLLVYVAAFCAVMTFYGTLSSSALFPSTFSVLLLLLSVIFGCVCAYTSLMPEINRGLLTPSLFMLYIAAIGLQIMFLDPNNPHNTKLVADVSAAFMGNDGATAMPQHVIFARYSSKEQGFMLAKNIILGLMCFISAGYSLTAGKQDTVQDAVNLCATFKSFITKMFKRDQSVDKKDFVHISSVLAGESEDLSSMSGEEINSPDFDSSTVSARRIKNSASFNSITPSINEEIVIKSESDHLIEVEEGRAGNSEAALGVVTVDEIKNGPIFDAFLCRMVFLTGYTSMLFTGWGCLNGSPAYSLSDYKVTAEDKIVSNMNNRTSLRSSIERDIRSQYYLVALLSCSIVSLCGMYALSLYSSYRINAHYRRVRLNISRQHAVNQQLGEDTGGEEPVFISRDSIVEWEDMGESEL